MKYIVAAIACIVLFAQCKKSDHETVQPTGSYDTVGIHWTVVEADNIMYHFQDFSSQSDYAKEYIDAHESAYTELNKVFNAQLPRKLRFFIWADPALAEQRMGMPLGFTYPYQCISHVRPEQTLGHEMTHTLSFWSNGGVLPVAMTKFVTEGVAVAFDLNTNDKIGDARSALSGQGAQSVRQFWSGSYESASAEIFYPVSGAFMQFLYKKNMPEQFNALLKNQTIEGAEDIYGKDKLDSFIAEFDELMGL